MHIHTYIHTHTYIPNVIKINKNNKKLNICMCVYIYIHTPKTRVAIAQSVWRWATAWTIGILGFDSQRGLGIFLFTTTSRTVLGPTQPPIQWVPGVLSLGVKWRWREADHCPSSSAEVKNDWSYTCTPSIRLHGVVLR
jgi:hypothetical protein